MRRIVVTEYISLDGVMENPGWTMPYWNDEIAQYKFSELFASDALLLGRVTYEGFAQAWPGRTDEQGFAERMNSIPKYVVSATLEKLEWNNSHRLKENIFEEILRLKQEPGENILVYGSATLVEELIHRGLVDELRLLVYPLLLGKGRRLFPEGCQATYNQVDTQMFGSGVTALAYQPVI